MKEENDDSTNKNVVELIVLGISMGVIHVLSGPDHLSALATLSANVGNCEAVGLGMRWGVGHSTGLVLVAVILIAISEGGDVEESSAVTHTMEFLVGIFMIVLGCYGIYRVYYTDAIAHDFDGEDQNSPTIRFVKESFEADDISVSSSLFVRNVRRNDNHTIYHHQDLMEQDIFVDIPITPITDIHLDDEEAASSSFNKVNNHNNNKDEHEKMKNDIRFITNTPPSSSQTYSFPNINHPESGNDSSTTSNDKNPNTRINIKQRSHSLFNFSCIYYITPKCCRDMVESPHMTKLWAFIIGIIHGIAGPGGVLGVIPAVQLHDFLLATIYLGTFCITSILVMGMFAGLYGTVTNFLSNFFDIQFSLQLFSALLCVVVGIIWCTLILTGEMDHVFPDN